MSKNNFSSFPNLGNSRDAERMQKKVARFIGCTLFLLSRTLDVSRGYCLFRKNAQIGRPWGRSWRAARTARAGEGVLPGRDGGAAAPPAARERRTASV